MCHYLISHCENGSHLQNVFKLFCFLCNIFVYKDIRSIIMTYLLTLTYRGNSKHTNMAMISYMTLLHIHIVSCPQNCVWNTWARFQKRSARDRLRYDPVILIGRSHSTNADHDRLIRSRKYETKQFIAN